MVGLNVFPTVVLPDNYVPSFSPYPNPPANWSENTPVREWMLSVDVAGTVYWQRDRPMFQGIATSAMSIAANGWAILTGLTPLRDNFAGLNDSAATGNWYPPYEGGTTNSYFLCIGYIPWNSSNTGNVFIAGLALNATTVREGTKIPSGPHGVTCMVVDLVSLASQTDYVNLQGFQNSAGSVNTLVSGKLPALVCRWVSQHGAPGTATQPQPPQPHSWIDADQVTASATGASPVSPGVKVPLNREIRDLSNWLKQPPTTRLTSYTTTQTIPSGAWTSIQMPTQDLDPYGGWSSGANTRWTAPRAGLYYVAGYASVAELTSAHAGYRAVRLLVNGATVYGGTTAQPDTSTQTAGTSLYSTDLIRLNTNDYVEVQMIQTQGAALPVNNSVGNASRLIAVWTSL